MDSANRNIPAEGKNKALGVSLSSIPPLQIESLDINQDILSEIAREYNIDDVSLLQEVPDAQHLILDPFLSPPVLCYT